MIARGSNKANVNHSNDNYRILTLWISVPGCNEMRPCYNGGSCRAGTCECTDGFEGDFCKIAGKIWEMLPPLHRGWGWEMRPCYNGGSCRAGTCECTDGFEGDFCKITGKIWEMLPSLYRGWGWEMGPCFNGGSCMAGTCECTDGFEGDFCKIAGKIGDMLPLTPSSPSPQHVTYLCTN